MIIFHTRRIYVVCIGMLLPTIAYAQNTLPNPLPGNGDPAEIIANIIKVFLGIVGAFALVMFLYGGVLLLISSGNPERVKKGQQTLLWATLGLIVIFSSYGLVQTIFKSLFGEPIT